MRESGSIANYARLSARSRQRVQQATTAMIGALACSPATGTYKLAALILSLMQGVSMLLVREIMYCKPGKVRPMVEKFLAMAKMTEAKGWGKMRIMTDLSAERYWTVVSEMEVPSMESFMSMMNTDDAKEFEAVMKGYHDLIDYGRREIYNIEG